VLAPPLVFNSPLSFLEVYLFGVDYFEIFVVLRVLGADGARCNNVDLGVALVVLVFIKPRYQPFLLLALPVRLL